MSKSSTHKAPAKITITSKMAFDRDKPRYNGFGCGYGAHGDTKYNRNKEKREFRKNLDY